MSSVTSEYLTAVKWAEESYTPLDFIANTQLPQVGKVIKGQVDKCQIGVPSPAHPTLNQTIFWIRKSKKVSVICQCVKFKEKEKMSSSVQRCVTVGPHLSISDDYEGWFEIISEDGRCSRSMQSVSELVKRFPRSVLVRESIKVLIGKKDTSSGDFLVSEKSRLLHIGEIVQLDSLASLATSKNTNDKYLKCLTSSGEVIFMRLDQKGSFTTIAKDDSISGAHSIKSLAQNKRFPLMVRLIHGSTPVNTFKGFVPTLRLISLHHSDHLLGMPMLKDCDKLLSLPLTAANLIRIVPPSNSTHLQSLTQYESLIQLASAAKSPAKLIEVSTILPHPSPACASSSLHPLYRSHCLSPSSTLIDGKFCDAKDRQLHSRQMWEQKRKFPFISSNCGLVRRHLNHLSGDKFNSVKVNPLYDSMISLNITGDKAMDNAVEYEEIDQIYDYIRGIAPLPESIKRELNAASSCLPFNSVSSVTNRFIRYSFTSPDHRRLSYPTAVTGKSPVASENNAPVLRDDISNVKVKENNSKSKHNADASSFHNSLQQSSRTVHGNYSGGHNNNAYNKEDKTYHEQLSMQQQYSRNRRPLRSNSVGKLFSSSNYDKSIQMSPCLQQQTHSINSNQCLNNSEAMAGVKSKLFLKKPSNKPVNNVYSNITSGKVYPLLRFNSSRNLTLSSLPNSPSSGDQRKGSPTISDRVNNNNVTRTLDNCGNHNVSSGRSFVTSPIFNIRYKSLNNINHISCNSSTQVNRASSSTLYIPCPNHNPVVLTPTGDCDSAKCAPANGKGKSNRRICKPKSFNNIFSQIASAFTSSSSAAHHTSHHQQQHESQQQQRQQQQQQQRLDSPVNSLDSPVSSSSFPPSASSTTTTPAVRASNVTIVSCASHKCESIDESDIKCCKHEKRIANSLSSSSNITDDPLDSSPDCNQLHGSCTSNNSADGNKCCQFRSCGNLNNNLRNISLGINASSKLATVYI